MGVEEYGDPDNPDSQWPSGHEGGAKMQMNLLKKDCNLFYNLNRFNRDKPIFGKEDSPVRYKFMIGENKPFSLLFNSDIDGTIEPGLNLAAYADIPGFQAGEYVHVKLRSPNAVIPMPEDLYNIGQRYYSPEQKEQLKRQLASKIEVGGSGLQSRDSTYKSKRHCKRYPA